jgi:hypothetical protein
MMQVKAAIKMEAPMKARAIQSGTPAFGTKFSLFVVVVVEELLQVAGMA